MNLEQRTEHGDQEINDNSSREAILAYIRSKTPISVDSEEYQGMSISYIDPAWATPEDRAVLERHEKAWQLRQEEELGRHTPIQNCSDAETPDG